MLITMRDLYMRFVYFSVPRVQEISHCVNIQTAINVALYFVETVIHGFPKML